MNNSILNSSVRPVVRFDVSNVEHRKMFSTFVIERTWAKCPVRFEFPNKFGINLVSMIQQSLLEYYMNNEFTYK